MTDKERLHAVTLEELNQAKVLILDLLGCGLSPENLVEAGISKQCLVPCLRELKLRLPSNIDLSDVVLFDPPPDMNSSSHPPLPPGLPKDDTQQTLPMQNNLHGEPGMADLGTSSLQREKYQTIGDQDSSASSEIPFPNESHGPSTTFPPRSSLLDRIRGPVDREDVDGDNFHPTDMDEGEPELHVDGSSVDAIEPSSLSADAPSFPHKGQKKQWKNSQGGKSVPAGRRKAQGHAVSFSSHSSSLLMPPPYVRHRLMKGSTDYSFGPHRPGHLLSDLTRTPALG
jgi:hypothetical protein